MTLVATFEIGNNPFIISDMLITFERGIERVGLEIPTIGPTCNLPKNRRMIDGLSQKLYIISANIAIAFAGVVEPARAMITSLRRLASEKTISPEVFIKFFEDHKPYFRRVAIVGFIVEPLSDGSKKIHRLEIGANLIDDPGLGKIHCAGTGVQLIQNICDRKLIAPNAFPELPRSQAALAIVVSACGHLINEETEAMSSILKDATGGAYEVAYFDGQKFKKTEITFMSWEAVVDGKTAMFSCPRLVLKSSYIDDVCVVNCARRISNNIGKQSVITFDLHAVMPIWANNINKNIPSGVEIGFESNLTQHQISVVNQYQQVLYLSMIEYRESGVSIVFDDDRYQFKYSDQFKRNLLDALLTK